VIVPDSLRKPDADSLISDTQTDLESRVHSLTRILDLLLSGDEPGAIRLAQKAFQLTAEQAQDAVNVLEAGYPLNFTILESSFTNVDASALQSLIQADLRSGNKIEAINKYAAAYGTGLAESKDAVEYLETNGVLPLPPHAGVHSVGDIAAYAANVALRVERIIQLADQGSRAEAIRLFRAAFDVSQQVAEEAVNRLAAGEAFSLPSVKTSALQTRISTSPKRNVKKVGCLRFSVFISLLFLIIFLGTAVPIVLALGLSPAVINIIKEAINPLSFSSVEFSFGEEGTGPGYLDDPRGIALDQVGSIYVANYSDGRVQRFNLNGEFQNVFNTDPERIFQGLAAGKDGRVFVALGSEIWVYNGATGEKTGTYDLEEEDLFFIEDLKMLPTGDLLVLADNENLLWLDTQGQVYRRANDVISAVDKDGDLSTYLAVDGLGNIYILGTFRNSVFKYAPDGTYINRFGSGGDETGQFRAPNAISVDNLGNVYVSDLNQIEVFASDGRYLYSFSTPGVAFGMAFDAENRLFAATNLPKIVVFKIDPP
jgi:sugar lactone lactonase YvrE